MIFSGAQNSFKVSVLVLPDSSMMCVASVLEPLRAANRVTGKRLYEWEVLSLSDQEIRTTSDVILGHDGEFTSNKRGDLLVIVAGFNQMEHVSTYALSRIRNASSRFSLVAGVEAGSWLLARAGLLDGQSVTTHWEDFDSFRESFPDVDLRYDRYVLDGKFMTCGGASPAFDMFLDLIRRRDGASIAMQAASVFIYDETHSRFDAQPNVSLGRVGQQDKRLADAVHMMEKSIEEPLPVAAIARRCGVTPKTLETIFRQYTGITPGKFYLNLRLNAADRMVKDTALSMQEIAVRTGFNSLPAFSRAYKTLFKSPPKTNRLLAVSQPAQGANPIN